MKKILVFVTVSLAIACLLTACVQKGNASSDAASATKDSSAGMASTTDTTHKYTLAMVVNKHDPSCGMPLTAGLEDTTHYKGKAYGFCSKECKNEFLKNPDGYIAKMK